MDSERVNFAFDPNCSKDFLPIQNGGDLDNVGICGVEFYFPRNYVSQTELENYDGVGEGKYTAGLGQLEMSFCGDNEDVCSMAMTVTSALLENYQVDSRLVGYLAVGTETLIDKSKSVKSALMDLFADNADIQGADIKNACYGGTEALFCAVDWLRANYDNDGRLAIVVCVDIAIYAPGAARCTGGAGAIAFLIGVDAPLVVERGWRAVYASNKYDFYKPVMGLHGSSEYPLVDGSCSVASYLAAVDATYVTLKKKARRMLKRDISIQDFHGVLFHSPFTKLTQKALAMMAFIDYLHNDNKQSDIVTADNDNSNNYNFLTNGHCSHYLGNSNRMEPSLVDVENFEKIRNMDRSQWSSREFTTITVAAARSLIELKLEPYVEFCRRLGNMYTPSLYAQLVGAIYKNNDCLELDGKKLLLFSYGSGCIAAMFTIRFSMGGILRRKCYEKMRESTKDAHARLEKRVRFQPDEYVRVLESRERLIRSETPWMLLSKAMEYKANVDDTNSNGMSYDALADASEKTVTLSLSQKFMPLFPGTYYLRRIDEKFRRAYARTPVDYQLDE